MDANRIPEPKSFACRAIFSSIPVGSKPASAAPQASVLTRRLQIANRTDAGTGAIDAAPCFQAFQIMR
jgi:hypothetical protein